MSVYVTATAQELADDPLKQRRLSGWHLSKIDGTHVVPPMLVEAMGTTKDESMDYHTLDITVWPANGWMVGIQITVDNGLTSPNTLEFVYNPS